MKIGRFNPSNIDVVANGPMPIIWFKIHKIICAFFFPPVFIVECIEELIYTIKGNRSALHTNSQRGFNFPFLPFFCFFFFPFFLPIPTWRNVDLVIGWSVYQCIFVYTSAYEYTTFFFRIHFFRTSITLFKKYFGKTGNRILFMYTYNKTCHHKDSNNKLRMEQKTWFHHIFIFHFESTPSTQPHRPRVCATWLLVQTLNSIGDVMSTTIDRLSVYCVLLCTLFICVSIQ